MSHKTAYIMRGVSGSGKSTLAAKLAPDDGKCYIFSTDDYFMEGDNYVFRAEDLTMNHAKNLERWKSALNAGIFETVVCDNTNPSEWEYAPYVEIAEAAGYSVVFMVLKPRMEDLKTYAERNSHGVPLEAIVRQAERFE